MDILNKCPVCEHTTFTHYLTCEDYTVSHTDFSLVRCDNCEFVFTNPRPTAEDIGKYYDSKQYISHSDIKTGIINRLYHIVRRITLKKKLRLINKLNNKQGDLIDVGCGSGYFLETCKEAGWKVQGIEVDKSTREVASKRLNQTLGSSIHDFNKEELFDIITFWHVLEHVSDLHENIKWLKAHLAANGKAIIAVPNIHCFDSRYYDSAWAAYDVPRHLYHFSKKSMTTLMNRNDLNVEAILPMKFDSFYINMLSEKYKNGRSNHLRAAIIGLYSNVRASLGKKEYASLIYLVKHA